MKNLTRFILTLISFAIISCGTKQPKPDYISPGKDYSEVVEANTQRKEEYSGLYNTVTAGATLLRTEVIRATIDHRAGIYQWDENTYRLEMQKAIDQSLIETQMFVSFYTPERKHDDLNKPTTVWKIFLDVGGKRFEGTAKKIKLITSEVKSMYPIHNQFSTPYMVTFPISTKQVDDVPVKFTVTGPVGSLSLDF
ncbi:MAG: hypothetical protein V4736_01660 [Bdellovibrionota bacterium]